MFVNVSLSVIAPLEEDIMDLDHEEGVEKPLLRRNSSVQVGLFGVKVPIDDYELKGALHLKDS